jgi:hypothetical protein
VPPGYKIIEVGKPDGTIIRVKRPINPAQTSVEKKAVAESAEPATNGAAEAVPTPIKIEASKPVSDSTPTSVPVSKSTSAPSSAEQNTLSQRATSTAPQAVEAATVQPKHRPTRPFFSAFAARAVTALIPDIGDIGELHDGDEILDDDHYDSDDFDDGDGDHDDMQHEDSTTKHHQLGNSVVMAGATGLAAGLTAQPPACART